MTVQKCFVAFKLKLWKCTCCMIRASLIRYQFFKTANHGEQLTEKLEISIFVVTLRSIDEKLASVSCENSQRSKNVKSLFSL